MGERSPELESIKKEQVPAPKPSEKVVRGLGGAAIKGSKR